jgi:aarF domain-containing kinase
MSGWSRVASGLARVVSFGANRMTQGILSSDPQSAVSRASVHLPDFVESILVKTGGIAAVKQHQHSSNVQHQQQQDDGLVQGKKQRFDHVQRQSDVDKDTTRHAFISHDARTDEENDEKICTSHANERHREGISQQLTKQSKSLHDETKQTNLNLTIANPNERSYASYDNEEDYTSHYDEVHQNQHLPEGRAVPSTRISRAFGFASLGAGLALGTAAELARRTFGVGSSDSSNGSLVLSNDANAQRLSNSLRRMRGAAMKLGQMLSIQDESIVPPALTNALAQVRKGAEAMPTHQLMNQLNEQWGDGWKDRIDIEERPFAAASIGQVHRATLLSSDTQRKVAVKVQYPGVANSIESDLSNLSMLVKATGLAPPGLFLDNVIRVGREELKVECDYRRELANHRRFQQLISSDPGLVADRFVVPDVIEELSTDRILVTEYVQGGTIDKVVDFDQSERNRVGKAILRLTMLELFLWRFMQTDPNWGNFLYDVRTRTTFLIDFGAARDYDEKFVRGYLNIVKANADRNEKLLMDESIRMGFLTGDENDLMLEAHKMSGFCLGEPFQSYEPYNFKTSRITSRISENGAVFLQHRLTPPPEEVYTLHRKLAGAYNLCIKIGAIVSCRDLLDEVIEHFELKGRSQEI